MYYESLVFGNQANIISIKNIFLSMKTHVPECDALDTYVVYKPFIIIYLSFLGCSVFHLEISYHVII